MSDFWWQVQQEQEQEQMEMSESESLHERLSQAENRAINLELIKREDHET